MATGMSRRDLVSAFEPRPFGTRLAVLALALVVLLPLLVALWWLREEEGTVGTQERTPVAVVLQPDDLLDVADLQAVWPGPWAVLRTAAPRDFGRPLVGCAPTASPVPDPVSAWARWSIHAPPQSDGPALTQLLSAARTPGAAAAAVSRVRGWVADCPTELPQESGTQGAEVLRELPAVGGFLAQVRHATPDYEAYEQVAVGRVGSVVVLVSFGEYPAPLAHRPPDPGLVLEAFDRAVHKAQRAASEVRPSR